MKVVYIAGPFRGPSAWEIHCNVHRAEALSFEVARLGAMPLTPHKNTENMHGALPDAFFLDGTMELLRRCDAVLLTENWTKSAGARAEAAEAGRRNIPCFMTLTALAAWLGGTPVEQTAFDPEFVRHIARSLESDGGSQ